MAQTTDKQLLFDFTFDDVSEHIGRVVAPNITGEEKKLPSADADIPPGTPGDEPAVLNEQAAAEPFGAWLSFDRRLSIADRRRYNAAALAVVKKNEKNPSSVTEKDLSLLRYYSGFGGAGEEGERGVLYDYYTSPPVAAMVWRLVHAVKPVRKGASILEPSCGGGVFFATAPKEVTLAGVEIDPRSAAAARLLNPAARIQNMSFEAFNVSRGASPAFDYVIGNAPFGERSGDTAFLDLPEEKSLDRYFVSRGVDNLKPGGVMALIVHPGVLENRTNAAFRASVIRKAVFLGAIRLNDHSFAHTHTQIQPDILFFQKHPEGTERHVALIPDGELPREFHNGFLDPVFDYYRLFPRHVMGAVSAGTGQWGADVVKGLVTPETVGETVSAFSYGRTVETLAEEGVYERIKQTYPLRRETETPVSPSDTLALSEDEAGLASLKKIRPGFLKSEGNTVYILSDDFHWTPASAVAGLSDRVKKILPLSENVREIRASMRQNEKEKTALLQAGASGLLEDYKMSFGVFPKYDPLILSFIRKNPAVSGIYDGLIDDKTDVVASENLYTHSAAVDGHSRAVRALAALREHLRPATRDLIEKWFPAEADDLIREMDGHPDIFLTPQNEYQLREDFISGDVWDKIEELEQAKAARTGDTAAVERFARCQEELKKAANWTPLEESNITPHASWMPEEIVNAFVHSDVCPRAHAVENVTLTKNDRGKWGAIDVKNGEWDEFSDPVVYYLNFQKQRSRYYNTEEFNKEYNDLFLSYISGHPVYRNNIETLYNRLYNAEIKAPVKTYPVYIEGWTGAKILKGHQLQSLHHLYRREKGISALGVGFGKTLTGAALYSLLRQEGRLRRAFFQVPNNKVKDWVHEISDVMPSLKVGYIDPETPGYSSMNKRYAAYHRLANSAYDILVFPESAAGEIQLSPDNDRYITEHIVSKHITEKKPATARKTETLKEQVKNTLQNGKTNKTIAFEDLGCDAIFVDEAHRYKNLFTSTLSREIGLNDGRQSAKAVSLFKKTSFIRREYGGKNIFLFTATPLTNSPLEYYNMLMYVAPEELEKFNILTIDNFIRNFADVREAETYDWRNGQIARKKILTGFYNIRTLQDIFFKYTDYQNDPKSINLDKPDPVHTPHIIPKDPVQSEAVKDISRQLEIFSSLTSEDREKLFPRQNYLTFYTKLRTASLDAELYDPDEFSSWRNPKLGELAKTAWALFQKTGAGQLVFCDRVFSSDGGFNMHDKIASYLVKEGFKQNQIAVVNGFTKSGAELSEEKNQKLISQTVADYNGGKYKIIIGTTACIGEGLNLQDNSCAIHHFDIPFRPSDFIQRNGRVDRQGNSQNTVHVNTYMAAGTIDSYSVNLVQNKADWIDELLKSKTNVFVNKDEESSLDPNELLFALAGEFGDAAKAEELRAKMKEDARKALEREKEAKLISLTSSLARLRAPLFNFKGDTSSFSYLQRMDKIKNIEKSLLSNPAFKHKDVIGGKKPFLYSEKYDEVIMVGDYYYDYGKHNMITAVNPGKRDFVVRPVPGFDESFATVPLKHFDPCDGNFIHSPGKTFFNALKALDGVGFYSIPDDGLKEKFYPEHLREFNGDVYIPVIQHDGNDVLIGYTDAVSYSEKLKAVNPFSTDALNAIKSARTITFIPDIKDHGNADVLRDMEKYMPGAHAEVAARLPLVPPLYDKVVEREDETDVKNIIKKLCAYPCYKNDPLLAAKTVIQNTPDKERDRLKTALVKAGCVNAAATKNILSLWSNKKTGGKFIDEHVHVVGVDV